MRIWIKVDSPRCSALIHRSKFLFFIHMHLCANRHDSALNNDGFYKCPVHRFRDARKVIRVYSTLQSEWSYAVISVQNLYIKSNYLLQIRVILILQNPRLAVFLISTCLPPPTPPPRLQRVSGFEFFDRVQHGQMIGSLFSMSWPLPFVSLRITFCTSCATRPMCLLVRGQARLVAALVLRDRAA